MTRRQLCGLTGAVSALALSAGMSFPASAFDNVNWTWKTYVHEYVDVDVHIDANLDPGGMVMLGDLQVFIGDVRANSYVHDIANNQPGLSNGFNLSSWGWGHHGRDALANLPEIVSAATAIGNNTSIESDTAVQLHQGQFLVGDPDWISFGAPALSVASADVNGASYGGGHGYGGNANLEAALALGTLAIVGALDPSNIKARSTVDDILNATVDSNATAVGNNIAVDVAATGEDRTMLGDVVQFAFANVSARSHVSDIQLHNYAQLGAPLGRPIVNSVATAIGNNQSISVRAPAVTVP